MIISGDDDEMKVIGAAVDSGAESEQDESWDLLMSKLTKVKRRTQEQRERILERLKQRTERARVRMKQPVFVKFKDKVAFTLGVLAFALSCGMLAGCPSAYPLFYTVGMALLIPYRLWDYRRQKWGYFLLDFCYYANLLLLLYLWVWPTDTMLFQICFAFANGPVGMAIIAWRNSLVFHSLDKLTSIAIHISPVIVTFCIRHVLMRDEGYNYGDPDQTSIRDQFFIPLGFYVLWQTAYYFKVQVMDKAKIERRNRSTEPLKYETSFLELRRKKDALGRLITSVPKFYQPFLFGFVQFVFTIVTLLPTLIFYKSKYAHIAWMVLLLTWSTWNGANFYVEIFAARYLEQLAQLNVRESILKQAETTIKEDAGKRTTVIKEEVETETEVRATFSSVPAKLTKAD